MRALRETIIPKVSLPEQDMRERIAALERLARQAGVDESKLKFTWAKTPGSKKVAEFQVEAIDRENMSLRDLLIWSAGKTSMRFEARGRNVLISHAAEGPEVLVTLRRTTLPKASLPEQDLSERIVALEQLTRQAGIDESKLKFVWTQEGSAKAGKFRCEPIETEDFPLRELLNQSTNNAPVRLDFTDNSVTIRHEAEPWPDE